MTISCSSLASLIPPLLVLVNRAAACILDIYQKPIDVFIKMDGSPVTLADTKSHEILKEGLEQIMPTIPIISEEDGLSWQLAPSLYWLIDPLDGTKGFIQRNGEFCINIALMENHHPRLGIIHAPLNQETFYGYEGQAWCVAPERQATPVRVRTMPEKGFTLLSGERSPQFQARAERFLHHHVIETIQALQSALKFCYIAQGDADVYLRFEECCEWDTAAGQALVEAAGGAMMNLDGTSFRYGKPQLRNKAFIVHGGTPLGLREADDDPIAIP